MHLPANLGFPGLVSENCTGSPDRPKGCASDTGLSCDHHCSFEDSVESADTQPAPSTVDSSRGEADALRIDRSMLASRTQVFQAEYLPALRFKSINIFRLRFLETSPQVLKQNLQ